MQDEVECTAHDAFGNIVAFPANVAVMCSLRYPEDKAGPYSDTGGDELPLLDGARTSKKFPNGFLAGAMEDQRTRYVPSHCPAPGMHVRAR